MAFNLGNAVGYLMLDTSNFTRGIKNAQDQLEIFAFSYSSLDTKLKALSSGTSIIGGQLTRNVSLPLSVLGTVVAKSAIDFESAFTGVRKTVDATEEEYAALEEGIMRMSNKMPQSASDIAAVMEIAGQLGVRGTEDLLKFTDTMIRLGDSTNMSSEEAATSIARIMNVMNTPMEDVDRFASTVVALGNSYATTESEIVEMANRMSAGGAIAGLTESQILALATAMSSVGINAEAGGTAMTQTFNAIEKAVANGGDKLELFAQVSGMSAEEFASAWENDPIVAIQSFIEGLGNIEENGGSATLILDELGLTGIRQSDMLKSLAQAGDLLDNTLETANTAWSENVALTNESETRYGTLASKLQILWNNVKNLAISFGNLLMPVIEKVTSIIQAITEKINSMSEGAKKAIVIILSIAAAVGPIILIVLKVIAIMTKVIAVVKVIGSILGTIIGFIGIGSSMLIANLIPAVVKVFGVLKSLFALLAANPIVLVIAAIVALVAGFIYLWNNCESFREFWINLWNVIVDAFNAAVDWIKQAIQDVGTFFSNLGQTISDIWNTILSTISSIIHNIVDAVVNWGSSLYNGAVQSFNQMLQGIKTVWDNITSWLSTALNTIVETVKSIGSALFEAGKSIFTSLWDGLKSVWESIVTWVNNAVQWIANKLSGATASVSNAANSVSGSGATGLDYISHDSVWQLHEGEAVLSKEENAAYRAGKKNSGDTYNFYSPKALTPTASARAMKKLNKQLAMGMI